MTELSRPRLNNRHINQGFYMVVGLKATMELQGLLAWVHTSTQSNGKLQIRVVPFSVVFRPSGGSWFKLA